MDSSACTPMVTTYCYSFTLIPLPAATNLDGKINDVFFPSKFLGPRERHSNGHGLDNNEIFFTLQTYNHRVNSLLYFEITSLLKVKNCR